MTMPRAALVATLFLARTAVAQPVTEPPPLATKQGDEQLARALASIVQDPAIPVSDPKLRELARSLMLEGLKQLDAEIYDQALANFLEAYATFPSPKILLNIASTLRDMGRLADAANTYQRYLLDPATGPERVAEVKEILLKLDEQLTILTIRVAPPGTELSIDAGPFIAVGTSLQTRVRPGLHLLRARNGEQMSEVTVNGFEGELKEVAAVVEPPPVVETFVDPRDAVTLPPPTVTPAAPPEHVDAWLTTGTQYGSDGTGNKRRVRSGYAGPEVSAIVPTFETRDGGDLVAFVQTRDSIHSGVVGVLRVDGKLRGAAGGVGIAIARDRLELDLMYLRSDVNGAYIGVRYRLLTGFFRPYVAGGVPAFVYEDSMEATKIAVGLRGAGGVELYLNGHLSVQADIGFEYFFGVDEVVYEKSVLVPTLGVIGRL